MIPVEEIRRAREVLEGVAIRTPLVRLDVEDGPEIWLKLELLQPVRSFKIRGAGNAVLQARADEIAGGVFTASAGNMAQGLAYAARLRGVPATIVAPEHAPQAKVTAIERYGGRVIKVPYDEWWDVLVTGESEHTSGLYISPVDNDRVMAGNGTIGLELLDGAFAVPLEEAADAVRLLAERTRVIAEGAGALSTAVARSGRIDARKIVCVVSGGNIDPAVLARILLGETP